MHPRDFSVEKIKSNHLGKIVEAEKYESQPGERRDYHILTRGIIANEIIRRVDPKGRTVGEILRYHISEPLGADAFIGLNHEGTMIISNLIFLKLTYNSEIKRTFPIEYLTPQKYIFKNMFSKSKFPVSITSMLSTTLAMWFRGDKFPVSPLEGVSLISMDTLYKYFNSDLGKTVEMPSANAHASARGLAIIGAAMANKGKFNDIKV